MSRKRWTNDSFCIFCQYKTKKTDLFYRSVFLCCYIGAGKLASDFQQLLLELFFDASQLGFCISGR